MIFSIRKQYLNYLSQARKKQFEIPKYLELLVDKAIDLFNLSGISCVDMLGFVLGYIVGIVNDVKLNDGDNIVKKVLIRIVKVIFARDVSTRTIFMDSGYVAEDAAPSELFTNPKNPRTREFLSRYLAG